MKSKVPLFSLFILVSPAFEGTGAGTSVTTTSQTDGRSGGGAQPMRGHKRYLKRRLTEIKPITEEQAVTGGWQFIKELKGINAGRL